MRYQPGQICVTFGMEAAKTAALYFERVVPLLETRDISPATSQQILPPQLVGGHELLTSFNRLGVFMEREDFNAYLRYLSVSSEFEDIRRHLVEEFETDPTVPAGLSADGLSPCQAPPMSRSRSIT